MCGTRSKEREVIHMAVLKEADFYYGAILSHCFHNGIRPMLIEGSADRQVYDCTTDQGDFKLFTKYRSAPIPSKTEGYDSWQFGFSADDITELRTFVVDEEELSVGLVCGKAALNQSEIAFLHKNEIVALLKAEKSSITISRKTREKKFRISMGGSRENGLQIECNRKH